MNNAFRRTFVSLILAASMALTACASWDNPTASTNDELIEDIQSNSASSDPRTFKGLSMVSDIGDVVPITTDPTPQLPVNLTDADGNEVVVEDISRILPLDLYGTYSKTIAGLGLAENIVGRTVSSTEPALSNIEVVTNGGHSLNAEAILNLRPSLVIIDHSIGPRAVIDQIRAAGVATVVMEPKRSIDTIGDDIRAVAEVVGLAEEGEKLAQRSISETDEARTVIQDLTPEDPLKMVFLYARGNGGVFFIMGDAYGSSDLIEGLGGIDMAAEKGIMDLAPANAEALAELNPDVFVMMSEGLVSTGGVEGLMQRPGIAQTTAGQNQRVLALPDSQSLSFGVQTGELLLRASRELYLQGGE